MSETEKIGAAIERLHEYKSDIRSMKNESEYKELSFETIDTAIAALHEKLLRDEPKPLTVEELIALAENEEGFGVHIWVIEEKTKYVYAALTDITEQGVVAIWSAHEKKYAFNQSNYGKTWLAYATEPEGERE